MDNPIIKLIRSHPFLSVMTGAVIVRLMAVIWSQGYIHSDDYYDSILVSWDWFHNGLNGADGYLRWKWETSVDIGRFPLYTMMLLAHMELCQLLGITSLGTMMFFIRLSHAMISLLPVVVMYVVIRQVSDSVRWALIGSLVAGFHFLMPFLGVRNLIEIVGGNIWIVALGMLYLYQKDRDTKWLYFAGIATGLAWMIRFQLSFAVVPIPFLLWWTFKDWRPALHYSLAVGGMILIAGFVDLWLIGKFASSSLKYLSMNSTTGALYKTIPFMYPLLLLLLLVPPFSFGALYASFRPTFMKKHAVLIGSTLSFIVIHWMHPHQQERFILPILPAFLLIAILAIWQFSKDRGYNLWSRKGWRISIGISIVLNLVLFSMLTFAYGHKGMIEPMRWIEKNDPATRLFILQPNIKRWAPIDYAGKKLTYNWIRDWPALNAHMNNPKTRKQFDYFLVYPKQVEDLPQYLDSLNLYFGEMEPVMEFAPSVYDQTLHSLNPRHNDNYASFLYRLAPAKADESAD